MIQMTFEQTCDGLKKENTPVSINSLAWIGKLQHDINNLLNHNQDKFLKGVAEQTAEKFVKAGVNPMPLTNYNGQVVSVNWMVVQLTIKLLQNPEKVKTFIEEKTRQGHLNVQDLDLLNTKTLELTEHATLSR